MAGFLPGSSGVRSDHTTNRATTTARLNQIYTPTQAMGTLEEELAMEQKSIEAAQSQIAQEQAKAIRSLQTNLCLIFVFMIPFFVVVMLRSSIYMPYWCAFLFSIQKGVITIFPTVANFGPIREVIKCFWKDI